MAPVLPVAAFRGKGGGILRAFWAILAALLFLAPVFAGGASAVGEGLSVSVDPAFAFNGTNVTITIHGMPGEYVWLNVAKNNISVHDDFVLLNTLGTGKSNWSIPIDMGAGSYLVIATERGISVNTTLSIVFDEVRWLTYEVEQTQIQLEKNKDMLLVANKRVAEVNNNLFMILMAAVIAMLCGLWGMFLMHYMFRPWREWKDKWVLSRQSKRRKLFGTFYTMRNPPPDGDMTLAIPGLQSNIDKTLAELNIKKGEAPRSWVIMADKEAAGGVRITEVLDVSRFKEEEAIVAEKKDELKEKQEELDRAKKDLKHKKGFLGIRGMMTGFSDRKMRKKLIREHEAADRMELEMERVVARPAKAAPPVKNELVKCKYCKALLEQIDYVEHLEEFHQDKKATPKPAVVATDEGWSAEPVAEAPAPRKPAPRRSPQKKPGDGVGK